MLDRIKQAHFRGIFPDMTIYEFVPKVEYVLNEDGSIPDNFRPGRRYRVSIEFANEDGSPQFRLTPHLVEVFDPEVPDA